MSPIAIYTSLQTKRLILILNRKNLKSTYKTNILIIPIGRQCLFVLLRVGLNRKLNFNKFICHQ